MRYLALLVSLTLCASVDAATFRRQATDFSAVTTGLNLNVYVGGSRRSFSTFASGAFLNGGNVVPAGSYAVFVRVTTASGTGSVRMNFGDGQVDFAVGTSVVADRWFVIGSQVFGYKSVGNLTSSGSGPLSMGVWTGTPSFYFDDLIATTAGEGYATQAEAEAALSSTWDSSLVSGLHSGWASLGGSSYGLLFWFQYDGVPYKIGWRIDASGTRTRFYGDSSEFPAPFHQVALEDLLSFALAGQDFNGGAVYFGGEAGTRSKPTLWEAIALEIATGLTSGGTGGVDWSVWPDVLAATPYTHVVGKDEHGPMVDWALYDGFAATSAISWPGHWDPSYGDTQEPIIAPEDAPTCSCQQTVDLVVLGPSPLGGYLWGPASSLQTVCQTATNQSCTPTPPVLTPAEVDQFPQCTPCPMTGTIVATGQDSFGRECNIYDHNGDGQGDCLCFAETDPGGELPVCPCCYMANDPDADDGCDASDGYTLLSGEVGTGQELVWDTNGDGVGDCRCPGTSPSSSCTCQTLRELFGEEQGIRDRKAIEDEIENEKLMADEDGDGCPAYRDADDHNPNVGCESGIFQPEFSSPETGVYSHATGSVLYQQSPYEVPAGVDTVEKTWNLSVNSPSVGVYQDLSFSFQPGNSTQLSNATGAASVVTALDLIRVVLRSVFLLGTGYWFCVQVITTMRQY